MAPGNKKELRRAFSRVLMSGLCASALQSGAAYAQESGDVTQSELEEVVVTGFRESLEQALILKREAPNARIVDVDEAANIDLLSARRVYVFGAFGFADDPSLDGALSLVHELSAVRPLASETQHHEAKVWLFE